MAARIETDLWLQSRRIAVTESHIAALDDIRLRLIEMSDLSAANETDNHIDGLRRALEYQKHMLIAKQARIAVRVLEPVTITPGR